MCFLRSGTAKQKFCTYRQSCPAWSVPCRKFPALFPLPPIRSGTEIRHTGTQRGNIGYTLLGNPSLSHPLHPYDARNPVSLQEILCFYYSIKRRNIKNTPIMNPMGVFCNIDVYEPRPQCTITGPAMVNIFAPTPRTKPSACVNLGRSVFCRKGYIYDSGIIYFRLFVDIV